MENFKSEEERERRKLNEMREHLAQIEDKLERKKKYLERIFSLILNFVAEIV